MVKLSAAFFHDESSITIGGVWKCNSTGKFACGVFLDFQKAFDTVNHKKLISKLAHYRIRGLPLHLIQNYLEKWTQFVEINEKSSNALPINHGVPLGPLLFLIYINDLNGVSNIPKIHHFADDTNILYASNSLKDINKMMINCDLKSIAEWLKANKISLNSGKMELVLFRSKDKKTNKNMNFRIYKWMENKYDLSDQISWVNTWWTLNI